MSLVHLVSSCCCEAAADDCCGFWSASDKTLTTLVIEVSYTIESTWSSGGTIEHMTYEARYEFPISYVEDPSDCTNSKYVGYSGSFSMAQTCRYWISDTVTDSDYFTIVDNTSGLCQYSPINCALSGCSWPSAGCDYDIVWCANTIDDWAVVATMSNSVNPLVEIRCETSSCKCCSGCILPALYTRNDESRTFTTDSSTRTPGCANSDPFQDFGPAWGSFYPVVPRTRTIGSCKPLSSSSFAFPIREDGAIFPTNFGQSFYNLINGQQCFGPAGLPNCGAPSCDPYQVLDVQKGSVTDNWFCYDYDTLGNLINTAECEFTNAYVQTCTGTVTVTLS